MTISKKLELVDHIATEIEALMEGNSLSFEEKRTNDFFLKMETTIKTNISFYWNGF
jgi:hypothetical protein